MIDNKKIDISLLKDQIEILKSELSAMKSDRDDCLVLAKLNFGKFICMQNYANIQKKAIDTLVDFGTTVAGYSSFWDEVWPDLEIEIENAKKEP